MFVVMAVGASEAEILGVKSQILAEGLTPFDHVGAGADGHRGRRRDRRAQAGPASSRLGAPAGRRDGHADQPPVQADLARVPPRGHRHPGPRRGDRRRLADDDGRARARSRAASSCSRPPTRSRRPAPRSCAAARSSRAPARTRSRAWASRACATSPRRASGPACRSSPRSWSRTRSTSSPSTPTSSRSAPGTCRTTRC